MMKQDIAHEESTTRLNKFIEQQHVSPINDLDELSRFWPANDDPDSLFEDVLNH